MGNIVQDYPSHGIWKNAVVVVGGYNVWLNLHCTWVDLTSVPLTTLQVLHSLNLHGKDIHATTVTKLFAKTFLLCTRLLMAAKSFAKNTEPEIRQTVKISFLLFQHLHWAVHATSLSHNFKVSQGAPNSSLKNYGTHFKIDAAIR